MEDYATVTKEVGVDTFGEWLREQRNQRRLTREEFAKRVGYSISALKKIENGERRPSAQVAELMANCLDVPLEERSTFVRVARGELSVDRLPGESKPVAPTSVSVPGTNLPIFPTPLIGRNREMEQLSQLLSDPQCRLLTLVGPGGIGKTRLAIETASCMQQVFADGVYFVPLASAHSARLLVPVIADSVRFSFHHASRADPKLQLFGYLREKQVLLLLDNLEQLLAEPGIELLAELLAQAARVKLLATSRESLGLQGEWIFELHGLPVPERIYSEGVTHNTSVELFLQRARRACVGFSARVDDYPAIVRICQLVDGNPLGLELAAGWVRILSCEEIAQEIEGGLDFLDVSERDIPARHRSMRAVFDHSWKLLTGEERTVLLRLSVFRGGFRREAAEEVAGVTLAMLSTLVTKSLVRRSGAGRFDVHELIRQFVAEQFAERPDEQTATQARHARYYLTFFGQADGRLRSSAQRETLASLTAEMDNFHAAWDWAVTQGEFALIEQTLRQSAWFYDIRGWSQEGLDMLGRAVDALVTAHGHSPSERTAQVALGHLLTARSFPAYRLAHYEQAQGMLERSLEILRPLNESRVLVESLFFLGLVMEVTGSYPRALELYSEGLEMATAIGDRWFAALCLISVNELVMVTHSLVKPEHTHERLQSALADCRLIGDPRLTGFGLRILSESALTMGRYDEARAALEESTALSHSVGARWGLAAAYRGLGVIAQVQGEHRQAVAIFRRSLDIFTELGGGWWMARVLTDMGSSLFALGNDDEAEHNWRETLRVATGIHGTPMALEALTGFATLQAERGDLEHALELLLLVLDHPASLQETQNRASALQADLKAQLTPIQFEIIQAHAREKTLEAVAEDLLK